jgi:hypothetical protein
LYDVGELHVSEEYRQLKCGSEAEHFCALCVLCASKHSREASIIRIEVVPGLILTEELIVIFKGFLGFIEALEA